MCVLNNHGPQMDPPPAPVIRKIMTGLLKMIEDYDWHIFSLVRRRLTLDLPTWICFWVGIGPIFRGTSVIYSKLRPFLVI